MKIIQITDNEYPKRLLEIKNPPEKLYVKGNIDLLNNNKSSLDKLALLLLENETLHEEEIENFKNTI